jgi:ribose transport system permease protein
MAESATPPFDLQGWTQRNRWLWPLVGSLVLWAILSVITGRFGLSSLSGIAMSASFLSIAALGQMVVITTGRGNIDLSIANLITLNAYIGLIVVDGQNGRLLLGLAVCICIGLTVGAANAVLVVLCRIPAMIATLASGYVLATATLYVNRFQERAGVAPILKTIVAGRLGGFPIIVILALAIMAFLAFVLKSTVYGRLLSAVGQNIRAARLSGVRTRRIVVSAFLISAVLASLDGLLLGAYVGGGFLEIGQPYLLEPIGAVVLGGSLILGGSSTAFGTLFGSVLLILLTSTMQVAGLPPGMQYFIQGFVVVAVLAVGGILDQRSRPAARMMASSLLTEAAVDDKPGSV